MNSTWEIFLNLPLMTMLHGLLTDWRGLVHYFSILMLQTMCLISSCHFKRVQQWKTESIKWQDQIQTQPTQGTNSMLWQGVFSLQHHHSCSRVWGQVIKYTIIKHNAPALQYISQKYLNRLLQCFCIGWFIGSFSGNGLETGIQEVW